MDNNIYTGVWTNWSRGTILGSTLTTTPMVAHHFGYNTGIMVIVGIAQGPTDPDFLQYRWPPLNEHEQKICNNQKIRSSPYTSFSCFGLYFTFITGALIIITSYILEPLLNWLHRRRQHKSYAHLEWISNNSLQLHRMAHEQLMEQEWAKLHRRQHPILRRPETPNENTQAVKSSPVPTDSFSPTGGSLRSDSAVHLSGRSSMSSTNSVSYGSWEHNALTTAIMNLSVNHIQEAGEFDHIVCFGALGFLDAVELIAVLARMFLLARKSITFDGAGPSAECIDNFFQGSDCVYE
ncbi:hypothetical protein LA080_007397 [Diaporthe eres]|nr:hypothetical protein LA080_007397 [Diaporthe eres]